MLQGFWWRKLKERGSLEDIHFDGKIILKWVSVMGVFGTDSSVSEWDKLVGVAIR